MIGLATIVRLVTGKVGRYALLAVVVGGAAFAIWSYVNVTQNRIERLTKERDTLAVQVDQYKKAVVELQQNFNKYRVALDEIVTSMVEAGIPEDRIVEFFRKNDFSKMTPEQVQALVNQQQIDIKNCLEVLSGKTRNGKANELCPDF